MSTRELLKKYHAIEIELLLANILGKPKEFLYMNTEYILSSYHSNILSKLIKRREKGEPMAYILGYKDFYGLRFKVNKNVLIPRPETEELVRKVYQVCKTYKGKKKLKILDLGTGSGCIVVSLAHYLKNDTNVSFFRYRFVGSDISSAALSVAKENAKTYQTKIKFVKSDLLGSIKQNLDIIIANLPYGWYGVKNKFSSVKAGLKYEPETALFTKEKGLMQIRRLLEELAQGKSSAKLIYLEFDPRQKLVLAELIKKYFPQGKVKFYRDSNNFWRCAEIKVN